MDGWMYLPLEGAGVYAQLGEILFLMFRAKKKKTGSW
jgi:hypothetical protein